MSETRVGLANMKFSVSIVHSLKDNSSEPNIALSVEWITDFKLGKSSQEVSWQAFSNEFLHKTNSQIGAWALGKIFGGANAELNALSFFPNECSQIGTAVKLALDNAIKEYDFHQSIHELAGECAMSLEKPEGIFGHYIPGVKSPYKVGKRLFGGSSILLSFETLQGALDQVAEFVQEISGKS